MAGLIITVISIVLAAIAGLMGLFYAGTALLNDTPQARANTLMQQSRQSYAVDVQYMLDHAYASFDDFDIIAPETAGYTSRIPILGMDTSQRTTGSGTQHFYATVNASNNVPLTLDGYDVNLVRNHGVINTANIIIYDFMMVSSGDAWTTSGNFQLAGAATHPVVQMCLKLNAMTTLPAGLSYAASGLPLGTGTLTRLNATDKFWGVYDDGAGFNYCYIDDGNNARVVFVFSS